MRAKLIAIDIDGTLINDHLQMTSFTAETLRGLLSRGHVVILASGRPYRSLAPFYEAIGSQDPIIAYNGIHVYNPKDPNFVPVKHVFPSSSIIRIAQRLEGKITSMECESDTMIYLQREDAYLNHYFPYQDFPHQIGSIPSLLHEDVYTAVFRSTHQNDPAVQAAVLSEKGMAYRHWTSSFYSEAYFPGVDKGSGLAYIAEKLGYAKEDIIAFGDSDNDLEMLSYAGKGFAIIHCKSPTLLANFPSTEKDNNHDGVALTLKDLLLK